MLNKINWSLLREQKAELLRVISNAEDNHSIELLTGIVHLIDGVQDYAVENLDFPEKIIFGNESDT